MFKIALLLCLVTFSISSQVNISFIIKQAKFLRELEEESFDYPIKSFSYLTSCGIKTSDFALSITYPVNYTLDDDSHNPTVSFKLKNEDINSQNSQHKSETYIGELIWDVITIVDARDYLPLKVIEKYFKQSPNEVEIKLSLMRKIAKGYDIAGYYTKKLRQ